MEKYSGTSDLLTVSELATYLRVHPTTIYRLSKLSKLPGFRVGSEWRFNRDAIDDWIRRKQQQN